MYLPFFPTVKTPQRGFSRLSMHQLSRHLSRMSTRSGFQHQFSTMSTTSGIFGDYEYGEKAFEIMFVEEINGISYTLLSPNNNILIIRS